MFSVILPAHEPGVRHARAAGAQGDGDRLSFGAADADVAGVGEAEERVELRAGGEVIGEEAQVRLAHGLVAHAVAESVEARPAGVPPLARLVDGYEGLTVRGHLRQIAHAALGQDQQGIGVVRRGGAALRLGLSAAFGFDAQGDARLGEGELVHAALAVAAQPAQVGALQLLLLPALGNGVLIDVHVVHRQHDALAPGSGFRVVFAHAQRGVRGAGNGLDVHRRQAALAVRADGDLRAPRRAGRAGFQIAAIILVHGEEGDDAAALFCHNALQVVLTDNVSAAVHLEEQKVLGAVCGQQRKGLVRPAQSVAQRCVEELEVGEIGLLIGGDPAAGPDAVLQGRVVLVVVEGAKHHALSVVIPEYLAASVYPERHKAQPPDG